MAPRRWSEVVVEAWEGRASMASIAGRWECGEPVVINVKSEVETEEPELSGLEVEAVDEGLGAGVGAGAGAGADADVDADANAGAGVDVDAASA